MTKKCQEIFSAEMCPAHLFQLKLIFKINLEQLAKSSSMLFVEFFVSIQQQVLEKRLLLQPHSALSIRLADFLPFS